MTRLCGVRPLSTRPPTPPFTDSGECLVCPWTLFLGKFQFCV